jgi:hypothetical protein
MNRRRWKVWVAGIALVQLLVIGVEVALLWPDPPSEVEEKAALIRVGMSWKEALDRMCSVTPASELRLVPVARLHERDGVGVIVGMRWLLSDSSEVRLTFESYVQPDVPSYIRQVETTPPPPYSPPPPPIHPLTRLRRTLARALPFIGE